MNWTRLTFLIDSFGGDAASPSQGGAMSSGGGSSNNAVFTYTPQTTNNQNSYSGDDNRTPDILGMYTRNVPSGELSGSLSDIYLDIKGRASENA